MQLRAQKTHVREVSLKIDLIKLVTYDARIAKDFLDNFSESAAKVARISQQIYEEIDGRFDTSLSTKSSGLFSELSKSMPDVANLDAISRNLESIMYAHIELQNFPGISMSWRQQLKLLSDQPMLISLKHVVIESVKQPTFHLKHRILRKNCLCEEYDGNKSQIVVQKINNIVELFAEESSF